MVKGVNKQIIEVNNTDSVYFERAVFYLRNGVRTLPEEVAQQEIQRFIAESGWAGRRKRNLGKYAVYGGIFSVLVFIAVTLVK